MFLKLGPKLPRTVTAHNKLVLENLHATVDIFTEERVLALVL